MARPKGGFCLFKIQFTLQKGCAQTTYLALIIQFLEYVFRDTFHCLAYIFQINRFLRAFYKKIREKLIFIKPGMGFFDFQP